MFNEGKLVHAWETRPVVKVEGTAPVLALQDSSRGNQTTPIKTAGDAAGVYVCGITPYDATHMGHAATYVNFDVMIRQLKDQGKTVTYVQNVTDIDDPLLERANDRGLDWQALAEDQTELFRTDMKALNVIAPDHYVGAVEAISTIVPVLEQLLAAGIAYPVPVTDGTAVHKGASDFYFDSEKAASDAWRLGDVSGYDRDVMMEFFTQRGGDPDRAGKHDALDPLLWRAAREGEPLWDGGLLREGRPGWHIECSVIARTYLPAPFTIQGGGSDLIFPHHEFSAGHASAVDGKELANHYVHTGMVGLDGEKMSKSLGNLVLVSQLRARGVEPVAIRATLLAEHFATDWFWTEDKLVAAQERIASWRAALDRGTSTEAAAAVIAQIREAVANNLDTPGALVAIDEWATTTETDNAETAHADAAATVRTALDSLLGLAL
ncbi:cysteine--1-D-myo-inosityl 2-amino-2-deoxy-alpha-D-glucopyranoside ligase [Neomicrococcus aestuarii]